MPKTKDTAQTAEVVEKPKTTRKKAPAKEPKVSFRRAYSTSGGFEKSRPPFLFCLKESDVRTGSPGREPP